MIPDTVLAGLRAAAETALVDRCTVYRPGTATLGTAGADTTSESAVLTGVPCMLRPAGIQAEEAALAGGVAALTSWIVRLPAGTDVRASDRLVVTTTNGTKNLQVLPPVGEATFEPLRQVACSEIA